MWKTIRICIYGWLLLLLLFGTVLALKHVVISTNQISISSSIFLLNSSASNISYIKNNQTQAFVIDTCVIPTPNVTSINSTRQSSSSSSSSSVGGSSRSSSVHSSSSAAVIVSSSSSSSRFSSSVLSSSPTMISSSVLSSSPINTITSSSSLLSSSHSSSILSSSVMVSSSVHSSSVSVTSSSSSVYSSSPSITSSSSSIPSGVVNNVTIPAFGYWAATPNKNIPGPSVYTPLAKTLDTTINYCVTPSNVLNCTFWPLATVPQFTTVYWLNMSFIAPVAGMYQTLTHATTIGLWVDNVYYVSEDFVSNDCRQNSPYGGSHTYLTLTAGVHSLSVEWAANGNDEKVVQLCWGHPGSTQLILWPVFQYAVVQTSYPLQPIFPTPLVLDTLSTSAQQNVSLAVGMRRLTQFYQGPWIRVRRSNDSVISDIGFVSGTGVADTNAALLFRGPPSNILYVVALFDQSGNYNSLYQPINARQPILNLAVSPPTIVFSGQNGTTTFQSLTLSESYMNLNGYMGVVMKLNNGTLWSSAASYPPVAISYEPYYLYNVVGTNYVFFTNNVYLNGTLYSWAYNSLAPYPSSGITLWHTNLAPVTFLLYDNIGLDTYFYNNLNGNVYEIVLFTSNILDNDRLLLETSQALFYQSISVFNETTSIVPFSPAFPNTTCQVEANPHSCSLIGCNVNSAIGFSANIYDPNYEGSTVTFMVNNWNSSVLQQYPYVPYSMYPNGFSACSFAGVNYADATWTDTSGISYYPSQQCSLNPVGSICTRTSLTGGSVLPEAISLVPNNPSLYFHFQMTPGTYFIQFQFADATFPIFTRLSTIMINGVVVDANVYTAWDTIHSASGYLNTHITSIQTTLDGNFLISLLGLANLNTISFESYSFLEFLVPQVFVNNSMYNGGYVDPDLLIPPMSSGVLQAIAYVQAFEPICNSTCVNLAAWMSTHNPFGFAFRNYTNPDTSGASMMQLDETHLSDANTVFCFDKGAYSQISNFNAANNQYWIGCPGSVIYPVIARDILQWAVCSQFFGCSVIANTTYAGMTFDLTYAYLFTITWGPNSGQNFVFKNCTMQNGANRNSQYNYISISQTNNILFYDNFFFRLQGNGGNGGVGIVIAVSLFYHAMIRNNLFVTCDQAILLGTVYAPNYPFYGNYYVFNNTWIHNIVTGYTQALNMLGPLQAVYIQNNLFSTTQTGGQWFIFNGNSLCPTSGTLLLYVTNNTVIGPVVSDLSPFSSAVFKNNTFQGSSFPLEIGQTSATAFINNTCYQCHTLFSQEGDNECDTGTSFCAFQFGHNYNTLNTYLNYFITGSTGPGQYTYTTSTSADNPCGACSVYGGQPECCTQYNPLC